MTHHNAPSVLLRKLGGFDRFGQRSDLIDLEQQCVAGLPLQPFLNPQSVGYQQIIPNNLDLRSDIVSQLRVGVPVVLVEWVLDCANGVAVCEIRIRLNQGIRVDLLALIVFKILEVEVV